MNPKIVAILLMGGQGERFNSPLPKQFHPIGGKPVFIHTLETFIKMNVFTKIILPCPTEWQETALTLISSLPYKEHIQVISGGSCRQESSYLSLLSCDGDTDYVVIHDAVRPFVSQKILQENIEQALLHGAVDTCIPSADTLVHSLEGDWINNIPLRKEFLRGQTPQSFSFKLILEAHKKALTEKLENSSDDCSLVKSFGHPVKIVMGSEHNIKITSELDLFLAERLLQYPLEETPLFDLLQPEKLKGKIFAVTGATGGIGQTICQKLLELGAIPIEISKTTSQVKADLTKYEEVKRVFNEIHTRHGAIHGLINCIGTFKVKNLEHLSEIEIEQTIADNLTSIIYCCQCSKIQSGGHIINVASSSYSRGRKEYPVYSAAKAAVVNFTQALAEARPELYVNVIVPQRTNTLLRRANFPNEDQSSLLHPQEIAEKIAQLLHSTKVSGAILEVRKKYLAPL
ncbi:MAG: D-ribitol-5-phosphate cytidylyltransferase [Chlamydiota bacterium]